MTNEFEKILRYSRIFGFGVLTGLDPGPDPQPIDAYTCGGRGDWVL